MVLRVYRKMPLISSESLPLRKGFLIWQGKHSVINIVVSLNLLSTFCKELLFKNDGLALYKSWYNGGITFCYQTDGLITGWAFYPGEGWGGGGGGGGYLLEARESSKVRFLFRPFLITLPSPD